MVAAPRRCANLLRAREASARSDRGRARARSSPRSPSTSSVLELFGAAARRRRALVLAPRDGAAVAGAAAASAAARGASPLGHARRLCGCWRRAAPDDPPALRHAAWRRRGAGRRAGATRLRARGRGASYNVYGPTETTVCADLRPRARRTGARRRPSAGRSRTRASTCWTRRGGRCRSACPGELYIGGRGRGARLPGPAGADGGAVRPRSVRRRAGRAAVPDGRPGAVAGGRRRSSSWAASTTR